MKLIQETDYVIQLVTSRPIHSLPHTFLFFFFFCFSFSETLGVHGAIIRSYDELAYDRVSALN